MERVHQLLLIGLPLLLSASDVWNAFHVRPSSKPAAHNAPPAPDLSPKVQHFSTGGIVDPVSLGGKFHISYCTSCSYKNAAAQTRNMLQASVPGTEVVLSNHQPATYKRLLSKLVPLLQFGGIGLAIGGDHVFTKLGYAVPPSWYNTLKQNRFGAIAGSWLIGNALQNALHSTGAFEIYYDGDLVFSKLQEKRFPSDLDLQTSIANILERRKLRMIEN
ncbi:hypothetical protein O6H91_12G086100 [Diphasiastrum complanatum]|uniref:Uncharacterized protein n=3 Tax=Diphasiastrum complanatum TaxID=34168 RepID=A0ACC2C4H6_DIPCM|nr:hypothetical protein O6H91_12G086100 [Diphasiastrum complanatum]KAJ7536871.1 hypothetical protein O6H91_12G086100 [Diphasiastrum complanatum]KAJ7536872.1 hypothetical protein O6H91_12G086100 [Diphasiastrum complanatum]